MSLPSINFLHLTVFEIQAGQTSSLRPPAHPDTMGENNTLTALKGCGVKIGKSVVGFPVTGLHDLVHRYPTVKGLRGHEGPNIMRFNLDQRYAYKSRYHIPTN